MPTRVEVAERFQKDMKRLKKKYPAVSAEVRELLSSIETDERPGDKLEGVGYDVYKVRLKNPSASKGKSGGFRAIYYVQLADLVVLLTIYSKTEQVDIPAEAIQDIINDLPDESDAP